MSIMDYNGSAMVAMVGQDCLAIGSDNGYNQRGSLVNTNFEKIHRIGNHKFIGFPGLVTDAQTLLEKIKFRVSIYEMKEERVMSPKVLGNVLSHLLYQHRFGPYFCDPIVAGLDYRNDYKPYICNMDLIGCINEPEDFVVGGTASSQLFGMCESIWEPNLDADALMETCSQALLNSADRDAFAGWGATVYVIEKNKLRKFDLKSRMD